MKYEHIFFDLDHTLWDFETNSMETLRDLYYIHRLQDQGIETFEIFHRTYHHHNAIYWDRFRKGYITREELRWRRMWRTLLDFKIANEGFAIKLSEEYLEILPTKKHLFHDTIEVLDYLRSKNYPMHLITNGFEKTQHAKLNNSGIAHYFTKVITSEAAGIMKPHAMIFEYAMEQAGTSKEKSLMVGDTLDADIEGAKKAGIDTVFYNPGNMDDKESIGPTYTITELSELKNIL